MWKQIFDALKQIITLTQETQKNKADVKALQQQLEGVDKKFKATDQDFKDIRQEMREMQQAMHTLNLAVQRLAYEIKGVSDNDAHERRNIVLTLENQLLRFERRLSGPERLDPEETAS